AGSRSLAGRGAVPAPSVRRDRRGGAAEGADRARRHPGRTAGREEGEEMTASPNARSSRRAVFLVLALLAAPATAADWPQFRGPAGTAVSHEANLPVKWSAAEGLRWKAELPGRGVSCPVVAGGRVYVTTASGPKNGRLHTLAFDAATGKKLWERQLVATGLTNCHPMTSMAAPTPVADGKS